MLAKPKIVPGLVSQRSVMLRQGPFGMTRLVENPSIDHKLAQAQPAQFFCSVEMHSFCVRRQHDLTISMSGHDKTKVRHTC